ALILALRLSGFILVAVALGLRGGLATVSWAFVASTVPPILLGMRLLAGTGRGLPAPPDPGVGASLRASAPLAINGGLALLSLRVEMLTVSYLRGDRETGLFMAALRVVEFLNLVPSAVCAGAMPALTREAMGGPGDGARRRRARPESQEQPSERQSRGELVCRIRPASSREAGTGARHYI